MHPEHAHAHRQTNAHTQRERERKRERERERERRLTKRTQYIGFEEFKLLFRPAEVALAQHRLLPEESCQKRPSTVSKET